MKRGVLVWVSMMLLVFVFSVNNQISGEESSSTEEFLKKYALAENFELGIELTSNTPTAGDFSAIEKYYFTVAHTINQNSILKFKTGLLEADYENNNVAIGMVRANPISLSLIMGLSHSDTFKPYCGFGLSHLRVFGFDTNLPQYKRIKARSTHGHSLTGGIKYISAKNISISLGLSAEAYRSFNLTDKWGVLPTRSVNVSHWSTELNFSLRF